jgi:hypothetical protein
MRNAVLYSGGDRLITVRHGHSPMHPPARTATGRRVVSESIIGSIFYGTLWPRRGGIIPGGGPTIRGNAHHGIQQFVLDRIHGRMGSTWVRRVAGAQNCEVFSGEMYPDVVIIGGGIVGARARYLARAGVKRAARPARSVRGVTRRQSHIVTWRA